MRSDSDEFLEACDLGRELSTNCSDENVARAKAFLAGLTHWPAIQEILSKLLEVRPTDEMVSYYLDWSTQNPQHRDAVLITLIDSAPNNRVMEAARTFLDESQKTWLGNSKLELTTGQLLERYLNAGDVDACYVLARYWISAQPEHISTPSIVSLLVERSSEPESIEIGRKWLFAHKGNRNAGIVLAGLISKGQSDLVDRAKEFLNHATSKDDDVWWVLHQFSILAILDVLLTRPLNPDEWQWIDDWFNANLQKKLFSMTVEFLVESIGGEVTELRDLALKILSLDHTKENWSLIATLVETYADEEIVQMAKEYIARNPSEDCLIYMMCALLEFAKDSEVVQLAKAWLVKNQTSADAPNVIRGLAALDTMDDEIVSCGKAWLKKNPHHIQVPCVLAALTKSRPDKDLVKEAKQFLDHNVDYDAFVWVIRGLLKGSPDNNSIERAKHWLTSHKHFSIRDEQDSLSNEGLVISALLDAQGDEFVTQRAKNWLEREPDDDRVRARVAEKLERLLTH